MTTELLRPPVLPSSHEALHRSQLAPHAFSQLAPSSLPYPVSLLVESDSNEKWTAYENLFYACLETGDNASAALCYQRLRARFTLTNERIHAFSGILNEALAKDEKNLDEYIQEYRDIIKEKPTNMVMRKRTAALLLSMGKTNDAVTEIVELLDISPVDAEAWAELGEIYFMQKLYPQAIYCYEDVLLTMPNAWNIHARLGEILYISSSSSNTNSASDPDRIRTLVRALKSFCRSLELCDDYLRGFYGLHLVTSALQQDLTRLGNSGIAKLPADEDFPVPSLQTVEKLKELATKKLAEIVRKSSAGEKGWEGYDEAEVIAARALLDKESAGVAR